MNAIETLVLASGVLAVCSVFLAVAVGCAVLTFCLIERLLVRGPTVPKALRGAVTLYYTLWVLSSPKKWKVTPEVLASNVVDRLIRVGNKNFEFRTALSRNIEFAELHKHHHSEEGEK